MGTTESWSLYFNQDEYTHFNQNVEMIESMQSKIKRCKHKIDVEGVVQTKIFEMEYATFVDFAGEKQIKENAENCIKCMAVVISDILLVCRKRLTKITVRIKNYGELMPFSYVKSENIYSLVKIEGTVCRIGPKKIEVSKLVFECDKCEEIITICTSEYKYPSKCLGNCKSKFFRLLKDSTAIRDYQVIKLQELTSNIELDAQKMIDCVLYDDLVGTLVPGDVIQVVGVIKTQLENEAMYKLIIEVNSLAHLKNKVTPFNFNYEEPDFSKFIEIAKSSNIISSFIKSLFPEIYGNELILFGILLSLFRGTIKYCGESVIRPDIHILIVGDPGLGKSKMLLNACSLLPKSTFVCGNFTTTAGLTVSLTHDPVSNDYVADAGALVISDNGLCCIDEFDKLENPISLLEVMEDQMVSVAKGGVVCKVPARTTIIAAANPKFGHYDVNKKVKENIKFKEQVISRFDLVYLLLENVNEEYNVSENIIKKFRRNKGTTEESQKNKENAVCTKTKDNLIDLVRNDNLNHLLKAGPTIYEQELLKKYVLYARNVVNPVLTTEAKSKLQNYYLKLRKNENITIRDLESLMRLTEAKAKMELRNIASKRDAEIIIQLYEKTLFKEREKTFKKTDLLEYLKEMGTQGQNIFSTEELNSFVERLGLKKPAEQIISNMNNQGYLIKKGRNRYEFRY